MDQLSAQFFQLFGVTAIRYFIIAGIPFFFFYRFLRARYNKAKIQQREAGRKDFLREIGYSLQSSVVFAGFGLLVLFTPLKQYTFIYDDLHAWPLWWIPVSALLALVIHDTYFYWIHRLLHHKSIFRLAHVVHHKSVNPSPWASYSFHLMESVLEGGILVVVAFALPMHPLAIFLFIVSGFVINVYGHLGFELMPQWFRGSWLFELLNTSVHHNLHHSKFHVNYGLYFRV